MLCGSILLVRSHDHQILLNVIDVISWNLIAFSNSLPKGSLHLMCFMWLTWTYQLVYFRCTAVGYPSWHRKKTHRRQWEIASLVGCESKGSFDSEYIAQSWSPAGRPTDNRIFATAFGKYTWQLCQLALAMNALVRRMISPASGGSFQKESSGVKSSPESRQPGQLVASNDRQGISINSAYKTLLWFVWAFCFKFVWTLHFRITGMQHVAHRQHALKKIQPQPCAKLPSLQEVKGVGGRRPIQTSNSHRDCFSEVAFPGCHQRIEISWIPNLNSPQVPGWPNSKNNLERWKFVGLFPERTLQKTCCIIFAKLWRKATAQQVTCGKWRRDGNIHWKKIMKQNRDHPRNFEQDLLNRPRRRPRPM